MEVTGGWIKLPHELPNLYIPRDIVGVIKGCDGWGMGEDEKYVQNVGQEMQREQAIL